MERDNPAYFITIEKDPLHTPASVYEAGKRAIETGNPTTVFLYHLEKPNIVRGIRQEFSQTRFPQIRRPDLGLSWYHFKTLCIMQAQPGRPSLKGLASFADSLKHISASHLRKHNPDDITFVHSDLYSKISGKQVAGISSTPVYNGHGQELPFSVYRACFYTDPHTSEAIEPMLAEDPQASPDNVLGKFEVMGRGFVGDAISVQKFIPLLSDDFLSMNSLEKALKLQSIKLDKNVRTGTCIDGLLEQDYLN